MPSYPVYLAAASSIIHLIIIYLAVLQFSLGWQAIVAVMVASSFALNFITMRLTPGKPVTLDPEYITEFAYMFAFGAFSSLIALVMLSVRFGLPFSIGILVINGIVYTALKLAIARLT